MVASVILSALVDYISGVLPKNHGNQSFLGPELKIKPRPGGPLRADDAVQSPISPSKKKEDEIFVGLFTQQEMEYYYKHKKSGYDNIKALVEAWCGDVWNLVEKVWKETSELKSEEDKEIKKKQRASAVEAQRKLERWEKEKEQDAAAGKT